ncbi:MAG TPA: NADP-dependent oxidoreductase [Gemmatimonadaceae bacterium]|jgi:NADPH:quinone reductase-like Zn-dependent oxidoreductase|nr:NADP-dependent oxidoreductase [Gemmatimonadaceae bacterium]
MRAMAIRAYGPPEVLQLETLPDPMPGPGQVRVRVRAAGVQPVDCAVRAGAFRNGGPFQVRFPQILGNEFAGVVDRVGQGVHDWASGDEVIGFETLASYAELVVVSSGQIVARPPRMSWEEAGALSGSGQTAHTVLEDLDVGAGETILIHAAAGGVGTVAVQLARARGATVVGTASEANHDYLRRLGAIPTTYGAGLAGRVRALAPQGVNAAFDAAGRGALHASVELVADRDRIATVVDFALADELGVRAVRSRRSAERLGELAEMYARGALRIHVRRSFPLHEAAAAHREMERGHGRGKVVLTVGDVRVGHRPLPHDGAQAEPRADARTSRGRSA